MTAFAERLDPVEGADAARLAGLRYVSDLAPGIRRVRRGKGFRYVGPDDRAVVDAESIQRIRSIAIPPAWTDVWICPSPRGHIQAVGRDAKGRKQYRYHPAWRQFRDETKFGQLIAFGRVLPALRQQVERDLARPALPREKVLATVVRLLDVTGARVGNEEYARANGSFGLTTLRNRHVDVDGGSLVFQFRGKSGKQHRVRMHDRRLARIVKRCQDIPGYELFQYLDAEGQPQSIDSADVNAYLGGIAGPDVTAKVFRTWSGSVRALAALRRLEPADSETAARRSLTEAIHEVAEHLGNTLAVCRRCYIHPALMESHLRGELRSSAERLAKRHVRGVKGLDGDERLLLAFLESNDASKPRPRRGTRGRPRGPAPVRRSPAR